ncbi:hypothetical protein TspCOW1_08360 [Thiohalobacter sp. COW1]|uniref:hypothetical protein n=1 Tax=Thiohalobacter sp. COW1 TaxID=2795687 RepID=UPI0019155033|nr:hypothetical protein [Thiohalobacter sp. COW1]BCO30733.1 hypothetical protein TspCOW1_08360 [Thiohalobacter sp. COW1]
MIRLLALIAIVSILGGCASSPIKMGNYTHSQKVNYPEKGVSVIKGLGDRLVAKGTKTTGPALQVTQPIQFNKEENESSIMTCALTVMPGSYFKRGIYYKDNSNADCYGPVNYQVTLADGTTNWNCQGRTFVGDICSRNDGSYILVNSMASFPLKQDFQYLNKGEKAVQYQDNFIQELIYNGRVGNNLKFIYREFSNDTIRPAFSQDVQYDLNESNIIGFKGLRLKVINATNTEIEYILLNNF